MSEDMRSLLAMPDKGISDAVTAPAKLFRSILLDLNINMMTWDRLMREYLANPRSGVANNPAKRSSERSNLNRALSSDQVTWKKFNKALAVLNPEKVTIILDMSWDKKMVLPKEPPAQLVYISQGRRNALHEIFKNLVTEMGITSTLLWNVLIERYLNDPRNEVSDNPAEKSTERGNLNKMLKKSTSFTWSGFRKALSFLGVTEATLTLVLDLRGFKKKTTTHAYTFSTGKSHRHDKDD
jgi:hypothetical protein